MRFPRKRGSTSNMVRIFIPDNSVATGAGCTGLTSASTNLVIAWIRGFDGASTTYTGANIEAQTTVGTFQAPSSSSKIRFKAVDATSFPGLYELQFHDSAAAFGTGDNSESITINIYETSTTALKIGPNAVLIPLVPWDYQDGVRMGLTALPNAAAQASGGLYTRGTGTGQINQSANGQIDANTVKLSGTDQTARDIGASVLLSSGTGTGQLSLSSGAVLLQPTQTGVTIPTVTTLTNLPAITANWITAAGITAGALNGKGDWNTTTPPTASANAIATWDLARSGHTTSGTFGEAANAIVASDAYTSGTAQAGTSTTITLASDAPSFTIPTGNGGFLIVLISGTGLGQQATISAYNTSSKVATIAGTWKTTPDSTTVYRIYYLTATTADHVLDELLADHTISGSAGKALGYLTGDAYVRLASPVTIDLSQTGLTPRDLGSVADASLTVGDALVAAISGATGKESKVSTSYVVKTPYTGTVIRSFTLDNADNPTSRT